MMYFCFFFFSSRRRHTRFDCDWSSDVCSSDLLAGGIGELDWLVQLRARGALGADRHVRVVRCSGPGGSRNEIGRGSWRGRGEISVGGGLFKKKKKTER